MLASTHTLFQPTTPCLIILGRELSFRFKCQRVFLMKGSDQAVSEIFGVQLLAFSRVSQGNNGVCIGFDNRSSRSSTLVDIQWLKKLSQCFTVLARLTWHKMSILQNILKIIYAILCHLGFLTNCRSCIWIRIDQMPNKTKHSVIGTVF